MARKTYKISPADRRAFNKTLIKALARADSDGTLALEHVINALIRNGILGKEASIKMIMDSLDGKMLSAGALDGHGEVQAFEFIAVKAVYPKDIEPPREIEEKPTRMVIEHEPKKLN